MEENTEFGNIKSSQKLGTLTIKTPNGNVKFEIDSGENKTVDLSSYATQQGSFMGNWSTFASIPSTASGFTGEGYDAPTNNSFLIVQKDETHDNQISKYRYIADGAYSKSNWDYEFGIETNISLTEEQTDALNSGITQEVLSDIQDRISGLEQFNQDNIVQPIVDAVSGEAQTRTQQVQTINQNIQRIQSQIGMLGSMSRYSIQIMTQAEYDGLEHRDATTLYFITDEQEEEL